MFWFLFRTFIKSVGKKLLNPFKNLKNFLKRPAGVIGKKLNNGINVVAKTKNVFRKANDNAVGAKGKVRRLSRNARLEDDILKKATLLDQLVNEQNDVLKNKTSVIVDKSVLTKEIIETKNILKTKKSWEKEDIKKHIEKELVKLDIKSEEDITKAINDDKFFHEKVMANSHREFMENWKNAFFAYDPADLGMSEDEREIIWQEIEEEKTYAWFQANKMR